MDVIDEEVNQGGRPPKITDPAILRNVMDVKITEQLSWPALAEWYEDEYKEPIHHTTLRRSVMRDAPTLLIHERVSKRVKFAIENIWDQVDILRLVMYMFNGCFAEWGLLHEKSLMSYMDEGTLFTDEEKKRMDGLRADMMSFFMRALTVMRDLKSVDAPTPEFELLLHANAKGPAAASDNAEVEGQLTPTSITEMVALVAQKTQEMLDGVHNRHRESGSGFYRQLPDDDEYDLMEVDGG